MTADQLGLGRDLLDDPPARLAADWIRQLAAGRKVPSYGTPEWVRAPRDLQIAAMALAAEAHRREQLFLPQALADELAAQRALLDQQDTRAFADLAGRITAFGDVARRADALSRGASHTDLQRRRAEPHRPVPHTPTPWQDDALLPDCDTATWCWSSQPDPDCPCRWCHTATTPERTEDVA